MGGIVKLHVSGDFKKTTKFLEHLRARKIYRVLDKYGEEGVKMLSSATPKRTGKTASSWYYEIELKDEKVTLYFRNNSMGSDGRTPIAIIIQQGHGTRNGGYVAPTDYINPVIKPLFDKIVEEIWGEVKNA